MKLNLGALNLLKNDLVEEIGYENLCNDIINNLPMEELEKVLLYVGYVHGLVDSLGNEIEDLEEE